MTALSTLDVQTVKGDLSDSNFLSAKMEGCDAVFHSAAYVAIENVNIPLMHEINVVGTKNICKAAIAANIPRKILRISERHLYVKGKSGLVHD